MDTVMLGFAWSLPIGVIGTFVWLTVSAAYRHGERIEEKKSEHANNTIQMRKEHMENELIVDKLMRMLQIKDWEWEHKHDVCRMELLKLVQAMLDAAGDN